MLPADLKLSTTRGRQTVVFSLGDYAALFFFLLLQKRGCHTGAYIMQTLCSSQQFCSYWAQEYRLGPHRRISSSLCNKCPHLHGSHPVDSKRETTNSIWVPKTYILLLLALKSGVCLFWLQQKTLLDRRKETLAQLHGSWRSHPFPFCRIFHLVGATGTVAAGYGFIFQCKTASELFLSSHLVTGEGGGMTQTVEGKEIRRRLLLPLMLDASWAAGRVQARCSPSQRPGAKGRHMDSRTQARSNLCPMRSAAEICTTHSQKKKKKKGKERNAGPSKKDN